MLTLARPQKLNTADLIVRATDLFWKYGSHSVTTRDLERALGLRAPAIYRRYAGKSDLLADCIQDYVGRIVKTRIKLVLDAADSPLEGLHAFFLAMLEPHGPEQRLRGCLLTNTAGHIPKHDETVRKAVDRGFQMTRDAFERQVRRAVAQGELPQTTDASALGTALFISLQGLLSLARAGTTDLEKGIDATFALLRAHTSDASHSDATSRTEANEPHSNSQKTQM